MTDREKAIVMAYTGYCMLAGDKLKVFYEYVGELLGRPVYTHEFADPDIREKASDDFYKLCRETTPEDMDDLQKEMEYWHKQAQSYEHTICTLAQAIAQKEDKHKVIPCEDCKWWDDKYEAERCTHDFGCRWAKPNNFCGYAERRTE